MPRLTKSFPKYRHHKASGHAVVTLGGRDYYLGPYNSTGSKAEYNRLIADWAFVRISDCDRGIDRSARTTQSTLSVRHLVRHGESTHCRRACSDSTATESRPSARYFHWQVQNPARERIDMIARIQFLTA